MNTQNSATNNVQTLKIDSPTQAKYLSKYFLDMGLPVSLTIPQADIVVTDVMGARGLAKTLESSGIGYEITASNIAFIHPESRKLSFVAALTLSLSDLGTRTMYFPTDNENDRRIELIETESTVITVSIKLDRSLLVAAPESDTED